ncbi:integrin alpha [Myxococcota bacterium]|nr:integrin alpha [Myxococcota bacterium]
MPPIPRRAAPWLILLVALGCKDASDDFRVTTDDEDSEAPAETLTLTLSAPADGATLPADAPFGIAGIVSPEEALSEALSTATLTVDGAPLSFTLSVDPDVEGGFFGESGGLSAGAQTLTLTIAALDQTSAVSVDVTAVGNQPPTSPVPGITPSAPVSGEALFAGLVTPGEDPEGQDVTTTFSWSRDGEALPEYDNVTTLPEGITRKGEVWTVSAVASDGALTSEPGEDSVTIIGAGPSVSVSIDPTEPRPTDTLVCSWTVTEPDGEPITEERARWAVNGVELSDAATPLSGVLVRGDVVDCLVSATSSSRTNTAIATVTVVNTTPVVSSVSLTGLPATETASLGCAVEAMDEDGDTLTSAHTFYVNGASAGSAATLSGDSYNEGDTIWCEARVYDGAEWSVSAASDTAVAENSPPTAPTVRLSPDPSYVGGQLTCSTTGAAADPDPADTLTSSVEWLIDGVVVSSGAATTYTTAGASAGDTLTCALTVSDGDAEVTSSASLTLSDRWSGALTRADADLTLVGTESRGAFGQSLDTPGDLDGDGLNELLVTGAGYSSNAGGVFLYYGADLVSDGDDDDASASWLGEAASDTLGDLRGASGGVDLDGDGLSELLLGAPTAIGGGLSELGAVYVLSSRDQASWGRGVGIEDDAALIVRGDIAKDRAGSGFASVDLDGDGLGELLVSAPYADPTGASNGGAVAVYWLGGTLPSGSLSPSDADLSLNASGSQDHLGLGGLGSLGDLDGDGLVELLIGAPDMDGGSCADCGVAMVFSGGALSAGSAVTAASVASGRVEGLDGDDNVGISGVGLGDLDGDGLGEWAVGARFGDATATDAGGVYIFFGGVPTSTLSLNDADVALGGAASGDRLGWELSAMDLDGDGLSELLTGGYTSEVGALSDAGAAWIVLGSTLSGLSGAYDITDVAQLSVSGEATRAYVGRSAVALGDLNGDGLPDWGLGAQGVTEGGLVRAGAVALFWGP